MNYSLCVTIEPTATVAASCSIILSDSNSSDSPPSVLSSTTQITVVISAGNVFHPSSRLVINPPQSSLPTSTLPPSSDKDSSDANIQLRISENNLFEEECMVTIDMDSTAVSFIDGSSVVIGSYNQFAPKCEVKTQKIGNCNIFRSHSSANVPTIRNGNMFMSGVRVDAGNSSGICNDCVYFALQVSDVSIIKNRRKYKLETRNRKGNGTKINMIEVSLLLDASRSIVCKNHPLTTTK